MPQKKHKTKYIFVSGGVISGLGKGITTASIGLILKEMGFSVSVLKADMYLNVDAGTMNPLEHGEVFVTEDGLEADQDLGHYERFLDRYILRHNYMTMGQVYMDLIAKERSLEFNGKCIEGHVHVPEEIIKKIYEAAEKDKADFMLVEVGGTVGEFQNIMFFEAIRRMKQKDPKNVFLVHLVYLIVPSFLGEMKSKPAQASIYELYKLGLQPDMVVCRAQDEVDNKRKETISRNTGIPLDHIFSAPDVDTIYKIPEVLRSQKFGEKLLKSLEIRKNKNGVKNWSNLLRKIEQAKKEVKIAIVGKYFTSGKFSLEDSYVCVIEAIKHASWENNLKPNIIWFDVERMEKPDERKKMEKELLAVDGIIVPQGWGQRGVEGKIATVKFARENKIPYLGLCFGMQMAVIEFARNVCSLKNANSEEVNPKTKYPVIHIMEDQKKYLAEHQYGGTIRLGAYPCKLNPESQLFEMYKTTTISERHRHRYEFNNKYKDILQKAGLVISGTSPDGKLVEAVELPRNVHPFFVGTQFHPEYKSTPLHPHPIFVEFVKRAAPKKWNK